MNSEWEIERMLELTNPSNHSKFIHSIIHSFLVWIYIYLRKNTFKLFSGIKLGQGFF